MEMSLTLGSMMALFGAMGLLAALPSSSVVAVSSQAASYGFAHGAWVAAGVVAGDAIFIVVAIFGLALVMDVVGNEGHLIRAFGGIYLIWLGVRLWRVPLCTERQEDAGPSRTACFMTGLLITLGDQKAILFYLGLFPAFVDLARITWLDAVMLVLTSAMAVGGVKLVYAAVAARAGALLGSRFAHALNRVAACMVLGIGLFLLSGVHTSSLLFR